MRIYIILGLLALHALLAQKAVAQQHNTLDQLEQEDQTRLFGDLGRDALVEEGYSLKISTINDTWGNVRGGNYRGAGDIGNLNLILEVDTEKAGWWKQGQFVLYGIGVYGRRPSLSVGDYQFTSSIDAFDTFEPYEGYYEHSFSNDTIALLAGLHDFTIDFAVLHYGMTFVNSSFFTPPTITQNPYSFYPTTGLGTRLAIRAEDNSYLMVGIYDGRTTNPYRMRAHDWGLTKDDGAFSIAEAGWENSEKEHAYTKVAAGAWYNSGTFVDINGENREGNYGTYALAESEIWSENGGDDQGFGAFFQGAQAPGERNFNPWYLGVGLRYKGLFNNRDDDVIGIGFNLAQTSGRYRSLAPGTDTSEQVIEFNYRAVITPALTFTPDVQYVINPGANKATKDSLILYLRSEMNL